MTTLDEALRTRDFVVTAQLQMTAETDRDSVIEQAEILGPVVDAVQVTSNPGGTLHMSTLAAASLLLQEGIDPVAHMNSRDRNRIALRSDLLGARALGIRSLLFQRGDELADDYRPKTRQVYDIGSKLLVRDAVKLNERNPAEPFTIGAVITAFKPKTTWRAKSVLAKADAGARFLQTQMCFDTELLRRYIERLVALEVTRRAQVIVTLGILPTAEMARWARNNLRGSVMPKAVIDRLEQSRDPEQEGVHICAEILAEVRDIPGIRGVNLLTPGDIGAIPAAISTAGLAR